MAHKNANLTSLDETVVDKPPHVLVTCLCLTHIALASTPVQAVSASLGDVLLGLTAKGVAACHSSVAENRGYPELDAATNWSVP